MVVVTLDPQIVAQARGQLPRLQTVIQRMQMSQEVKLGRALTVIMKYLEHTADGKLVHAAAVVRGLQLGGILCRAVGMSQHWVTTAEQDANVCSDLNEAPSAVLKLVGGYLNLHELHDSWTAAFSRRLDCGGLSLSLRELDGTGGGDL